MQKVSVTLAYFDKVSSFMLKILPTLIYNFLAPIWSILESISPNLNPVWANFNLDFLSV